MPLLNAPLNVELKIIKILVDEKTKRHLENLGVLVNALATVIQVSEGNVIVKIKNVRLAINKSTAMKIFVAA